MSVHPKRILHNRKKLREFLALPIKKWNITKTRESAMDLEPNVFLAAVKLFSKHPEEMEYIQSYCNRFKAGANELTLEDVIDVKSFFAVKKVMES